MSLTNTSTYYGSLSMGLHWVSVLLILAVYSCIELRELYPKGSDPREALKVWHFMLGLSLFAVSLPRILFATWQKTPSITPIPPKWQTRLANAVRLLLYVLLLAMPILGWSILSLEGKTIPFLFTELPPLWPANELWAERIEELHQTIGNVGLGLIGLHTAAALFHHYALRDNTHIRMWFKR